MDLTVYVRNGCHLCEDMVAELRRLQAEYDFGLQTVDIDTDAALAARHGTRVPVLCAGEEELSHYFLDKKSLVDFLRGD